LAAQDVVADIAVQGVVAGEDDVGEQPARRVHHDGDGRVERREIDIEAARQRRIGEVLEAAEEARLRRRDRRRAGDVGAADSPDLGGGF
jgi:hypothetical protein